MTPKQKYMSYKDAISLVTKDTEVNILEKDAVFCYGMSKMTVVNEVKTSKRYRQIELPELNEFIGRVADLKYRDQSSFTLGQKIEFVLDDIFKLVQFKRVEKNLEEDEQSESDSDY